MAIAREERTPAREPEGDKERVVYMPSARQPGPHLAEIEAGQQALARGAWEEARACFEAALGREETPEALEGLGAAAWWLEDTRSTMGARRGAYRLYRSAGDRRGAARVATGLAMDHFFEGERAVARGWGQRARRLLENLQPGPERGWLEIWEAHMALFSDHDPAAAERFTAEAVALGRSLGDVDLEMLGLAYLGFALVSQGKISEGMRCLDEATTAAMAGEIHDIDATASTCCCLIYACERVRDYTRAAQWCERLKEYCERWSYQLMFSVCRTHYAGVLVWRGAWTEAESELLQSIGAFARTRPAEAAEALVRLAELRCRQGRFDEAGALLRQAQSDPYRIMGNTLACRVRGELALEVGDTEGAVDLAERFLRAIGDEDRMERVSGLELLVRARLAGGRRAEAQRAAEELCSISAEIGTEPMRGSAHFAGGLVAAAAGDYEVAKRHLEDALDLFERSGAPFETARARLELVRCLLALGRAEYARSQARGALEAFRGLGAATEAERARTLLHEAQAPPRDSTGGALDAAGLTRREVEVLRLVAQGLSNGEIAGRLVLSEHTVHRHVTSILRKLGLPSRTAAAAHAFRHNLL